MKEIKKYMEESLLKMTDDIYDKEEINENILLDDLIYDTADYFGINEPDDIYEPAKETMEEIIPIVKDRIQNAIDWEETKQSLNRWLNSVAT